MEPVSIKNIRLFSYNLKLKHPITVHGKDSNERSGFILELSDDAGNTGFGEIAPLPGLHRETMQDCQDAIYQMAQSSQRYTLQTILAGIQRGMPPYSSVAFGWDMARLDLVAKRMGHSVEKLLNPRAANFVTLNGLLTPGHPDPKTALEQYNQEGYGAIKIKVGNDTPKNDAERVNAITAEYRQLFTYRLDANRAWTLDQAIEFFKRLKRPSFFEYIEEPLADPAYLPELTLQAPIPFALDESLLAYWDGDKLPEWVEAVIIKPSVLGAISNTLEIINQANRQVIGVIITSCFESGLALSFYTRLAAAGAMQYTNAGLDTWRWLEQDVLQPPFQPYMGRVHIRNLATDLNWDLLEPVEL